MAHPMPLPSTTVSTRAKKSQTLQEECIKIRVRYRIPCFYSCGGRAHTATQDTSPCFVSEIVICADSMQEPGQKQ